MSKRWVGGFLLSLAVLGPSMVGVTRAEAYPTAVNLCDDPSLTWQFSNQFVTWPTNKQTWARAGINTLDNALDYDGTKIMTLNEQSISGAVDAQLQDQPLNMYGSSECAFTPSIWLNSNFSTASFYYHDARHEMFHLMGALHGGEEDSKDGIVPTTMTTCVDQSTFPSANHAEQDTQAYEDWLESSIPYEQMNANIGFEQGFSFWGVSGGGAVTEHASGGAVGPSYIGWESPGTAAYVYQTVRVQGGNDDIRAVANVETLNPDRWTVQARVAVWRRLVNWSGDNSCEYPFVDNPNGDPSSVSGWVSVTATNFANIPDSWTIISAPFDSLASAEGYDLQVRFYGTSIDDAGNHGQVRFDNVRDEEQP